MKTVKIYGCSDDLVEIEGDVPGCNEYNIIDKPLYVELDLGDVFKVEYTNEGVWCIDHLFKGGLKATGGSFTKEQHENSDSSNYSDKVTITGKIGWIDTWEQFPPETDEIREKISRMIGDDGRFDVDRILNDQEILDIYGIVSRADRRKK
jgi:hypothetical protein